MRRDEVMVRGSTEKNVMDNFHHWKREPGTAWVCVGVGWEEEEVCRKWKTGERPVPCVNSYRLNSTKHDRPCFVYQIPYRQVESIKTVLQVCACVCPFAHVRKWMSWFVYLCVPTGMDTVGLMCMYVMSRARICMLISTQICVCIYVFACFHVSVCALNHTRVCMVVFCLCLKDIHHEFLIHCLYVPVLTQGMSIWPRRGQSLNSSRDCVCV